MLWTPLLEQAVDGAHLPPEIQALSCTRLAGRRKRAPKLGADTFGKLFWCSESVVVAVWFLSHKRAAARRVQQNELGGSSCNHTQASPALPLQKARTTVTGKFQFYVEDRKLAVYGPGFHASGDGVLLDHALLDQDRRLLVLEEGLTGAVLQARHERLSALKRSLQEVIRSTTRPSLRLPACLPLFMHQVRKSSKVASAYGTRAKALRQPYPRQCLRTPTCKAAFGYLHSLQRFLRPNEARKS